MWFVGAMRKVLLWGGAIHMRIHESERTKEEARRAQAE